MLTYKAEPTQRWWVSRREMTAELECGRLKTREEGLGDGGYGPNLALFIDFELTEEMGGFLSRRRISELDTPSSGVFIRRGSFRSPAVASH